MSQNMNDQWGQQPAPWQQQPAPWGQQPVGQPQVQSAPTAAPAARNDLIKSLVIGLAMIVFAVVMLVWFDRLFYVLPIFGVVIIIQGLVKFLKARKDPAPGLAAWGAQQSYPDQSGQQQSPAQPWQQQSGGQAWQQQPAAQPWQPPSAGQPWQPQHQQPQPQQPQPPQQWN